MKKALFIATYGGFFSSCELSNINILQKMGYEVHGAANFECVEHNERPKLLEEIGLIQHNIPFKRNPFSFEQIKMYKKLVELMQKERFDIIDTHNPVVSILSRLAAEKCRIKPVVYTAHGFFFYKGCPIKNLLIYKPIEYLFSRITDAIIVINREDYEATKKMKIRGKSYYVHGVGFNLRKIVNQEITLDLRQELGIPTNAKILLSVGELNENKNHEIVIRALSEILNDYPNIELYYCICGRGKLEYYLKKNIEDLKLEKRVFLLGYRYDIPQINSNADYFILPSLREGLPLAIMEAMSCKLPILSTNHGGPKDLIDEGQGGFLFPPNDIKKIKQLVLELYNNPNISNKFGEYNYKKVKIFDIENVHKEMVEIYEDILKINC